MPTFHAALLRGLQLSHDAVLGKTVGATDAAVSSFEYGGPGQMYLKNDGRFSSEGQHVFKSEGPAFMEIGSQVCLGRSGCWR